MNILVTSVCNRHCPYCFAVSRVRNTQENDKGAGAASFIPSENFGRALAFDSSQERVVGILGGGPALHPEFARHIEQTWAAGFCAKVFTNGFWSGQTVAAVEKLTGCTECIGCKQLRQKRCSDGCAAHSYRRYA